MRFQFPQLLRQLGIVAEHLEHRAQESGRRLATGREQVGRDQHDLADLGQRAVGEAAHEGVACTAVTAEVGLRAERLRGPVTGFTRLRGRTEALHLTSYPTTAAELVVVSCWVGPPVSDGGALLTMKSASAGSGESALPP